MPKALTTDKPKCITNGKGCVDYGKVCSDFKGTLEECSTFLATDGPCKTTAIGDITASGTCAKRECVDALNTNNTDALCIAYHPSCVTTGNGCVSGSSSINCNQL